MPQERPAAVLWEVEWEGQRLRCAIYRTGAGLQMRLESGTAVVMAEPFEMQPRAIARTRLLRRSLTRRGWREAR